MAKRNAAGAPTPLPKPTTIGVLNSMAEIGAEPVTVRNSTPSRPTAFLRSLGTSSRCETSRLSARPFAAATPTAGPSPPADACSVVSGMQPASSVGGGAGVGTMPDGSGLTHDDRHVPSSACQRHVSRGGCGCRERRGPARHYRHALVARRNPTVTYRILGRQDL